MKLKILAVALAVTILAAMAAGPAKAQDVRSQLVKESTIEKVLKRGVLRVGFDTFVPWAMKDKTGEWIGFEIEVARRLAADMGVELELVPTKWSGIIPALLTGKFDVLIGGMSIRPDRAKKVNFTIPYYYSGMSMVANRKLAPGYDSLEDFNKKNVTIAARTGTTAAKAAQKNFPEAEIVLFDAEPQALQELYNNRAHAFVSMAPLPAFEAIKHPDRLYLPMAETFTKEPNGFAIRKGDVDTLNYFNSWIRVVAAEGWFGEKQHYWFGTRDWADQIR